MVRALQRSILGRNCGASFCSIRTQRTPRCPSAMASVSPTGPAPTMRTWVFDGMRWVRAALPACVDDEAGFGHDLLPFDDVVGDEVTEMLRRAAAHTQTLPAKLLDDLGRAQDVVDGRVVAIDDVLRRSCGRQHAEPQIDFEAGEAKL